MPSIIDCYQCVMKMHSIILKQLYAITVLCIAFSVCGYFVNFGSDSYQLWLEI